MMRCCIVCHRRLWFSRTGHRTLPGGRIVQWHAWHKQGIRTYPGLILTLPAGDYVLEGRVTLIDEGKP